MRDKDVLHCFCQVIRPLFVCSILIHRFLKKAIPPQQNGYFRVGLSAEQLEPRLVLAAAILPDVFTTSLEAETNQDLQSTDVVATDSIFHALLFTLLHIT